MPCCTSIPAELEGSGEEASTEGQGLKVEKRRQVMLSNLPSGLTLYGR